MRLIYFIFLLVFVNSCAFSPKVSILQLPRETEKAPPVTKAQEIEAGETLVYAVDWRGIYAGQIILNVKEITNFANRQCYHIIAQARPNRFFRLFYNVTYIVETYIDKETNRPLRFYKKRIYGGKVTEEIIDFYYKNNIAVWQYTGVKSKTIKLTKDVQDLLSSLYYFRLIGLTMGEEYPMDIVYNGEIWKLNAKIETLELLKMPHKKNIKAYTVKLSSKLSEHITGEQKIKIYFSIQHKHTPLFFNFNTQIGPLHGVLKNIPKEEFNENAH